MTNRIRMSVCEGKGSNCKSFLLLGYYDLYMEERKMKTKVTVVLNKTKNGRPQVFVEVANKMVEAENSPNKRWEVNVPDNDPVSNTEFKLILQQLGLDY